MKYRIGVVSALLGLSQEGLRLYERSGILNTKRELSSGNYRSYSHLDITALIRARSYHNYGFSMQEMEKLINTDSIDTVLDEFAGMKEKLEEELAWKEMLMKYMGEMLALIKTIPEDTNRIVVSSRPAMYRFEFIERDKLIIEPEQYKSFQRWVNLTPISFASQRDSWEDIINGRQNSKNAMAITAEYAEKLGVAVDENVTYYPECTCLYTIEEQSGEESTDKGYLKRLINYVNANDIRIDGDVISRSFLSMNKKENYTRYRQVWLPIK